MRRSKRRTTRTAAGPPPSNTLETFLRPSVSTIAKLPVETIVAIFRFACEPYSYRAHLTISQTCSQWRAIAIADRQLWTAVTFEAMPEKIVTLFLDRSAPLPIKLTWKAGTEAEFARWDDLVMTLARPLSTVFVVLSRGQTFPRFLRSSGERLQMLKELHIALPDGMQFEPLFNEQRFFAFAKLSLCGGILPTVWRISMTHLTVLALINFSRNFPLTAVTALFENAPLLETVILIMPGFASQSQGADSIRKAPVHIPRMRSLRIEIKDVDDIRAFLMSISIPELNVDVVVVLDDTANDLRDPTRFLPDDLRNLPPLRTFNTLYLYHGSQPGAPLDAPPSYELKCAHARSPSETGPIRTTWTVLALRPQTIVATIDRLVAETLKGDSRMLILFIGRLLAAEAQALSDAGLWAAFARSPQLPRLKIEHSPWAVVSTIARALRPPQKRKIPSVLLRDVPVNIDELVALYDPDAPWEVLFIQQASFEEEWMARLSRGDLRMNRLQVDALHFNRTDVHNSGVFQVHSVSFPQSDQLEQ